MFVSWCLDNYKNIMVHCRCLGLNIQLWYIILLCNMRQWDERDSQFVFIDAAEARHRH